MCRLLEGGRLLVDGPYMDAERDLTLPYRGSATNGSLTCPAPGRGAAVEWEA